MPTRIVRRALAAIVVIVPLLTAGCERTQAQATLSGPLPVAVAGFLDGWLLGNQNPRAAVARHLSLRLTDVRLVPAESYAPEEYRKLTSGGASFAVTLPAASELFARAMSRWSPARPLAVQSRLETLAPIDQEAVPDLWEGLREFDITPTLLSEVPALTYRLRDFSSYEWVSPVTIGYRTLVPDMISKGLHVQGVIARIRVRDTSKAWMLFMFWANEGTEAREDWKLLGLAPVPTE